MKNNANKIFPQYSNCNYLQHNLCRKASTLVKREDSNPIIYVISRRAESAYDTQVNRKDYQASGVRVDLCPGDLLQFVIGVDWPLYSIEVSTYAPHTTCI